jgi:DNA-binding CsgD family transcriptional regulator
MKDRVGSRGGGRGVPPSSSSRRPPVSGELVDDTGRTSSVGAEAAAVEAEPVRRVPPEAPADAICRMVAQVIGAEAVCLHGIDDTRERSDREGSWFAPGDVRVVAVPNMGRACPLAGRIPGPEATAQIMVRNSSQRWFHICLCRTDSRLPFSREEKIRAGQLVGESPLDLIAEASSPGASGAIRRTPASGVPRVSQGDGGERLLSDREWDVALTLAKGRSYVQTGRIHGITPGTVRAHVNRMYAKLGIRGRAELTRYVLEARENRALAQRPHLVSPERPDEPANPPRSSLSRPRRGPSGK